MSGIALLPYPQEVACSVPILRHAAIMKLYLVAALGAATIVTSRTIKTANHVAMERLMDIDRKSVV